MKKIKTGDLVKYKNLHGHVVSGKFVSKSWTGLVIEVKENSVNKSGKNIIVWWYSGIRGLEHESALDVISESGGSC